MAFLSYIKDLSLSVRKRGVMGTARLIVPELTFDLRYGTDTLRLVSAEDLRDVTPSTRTLGHGYQGVSSWLFKSSIRILRKEFGLIPSNHTFIDIGSGKGRGLLLAAQAGFRRTIGVEYSPSLVTISRSNTARFRKVTKTTTLIETVLADARDYEPPEDASFFFLFNPFKPPLLDEVVQRLRTRHPGAYFLYMNPLFPTSFEIAGLQPIRAMHLTSARHVDAIAYRAPSSSSSSSPFGRA